MLALAAVVLVIVAGATAFAVQQRGEVERQRATPPSSELTTLASVEAGPRIVFRHTGLDRSYGKVAIVPLDDPGGARAFTDIDCDRIAAWDGGASCLVTDPGVVTNFRADELGSDWSVTGSRPLPGIPSRTRVSADGALVATTSFVAGHSYMSAGFSTATEVHETSDGADWGNLERFTLTIDGRTVRPADRNVWGVTFVDDATFFATVAAGDRTWLVRGDLQDRSLTSVAEEAECPAVSPDRTSVAFKVDVEPGDATTWGLAVHDLASGERTVLERGPRGVDDQVEWLDDDTLLYGLPRRQEPGVTDVWALDTDPQAEPRLLIEQAWSPSVVR